MIFTRVVIGAQLSEHYRLAVGGQIIYADLPREEQLRWQETARRAAMIAFESTRFKQLKRWKDGYDLHEIAPQLAVEAHEPHSPAWDTVARAAAELFLYCRDKQVLLPMIGRRTPKQ